MAGDSTGGLRAGGVGDGGGDTMSRLPNKYGYQPRDKWEAQDLDAETGDALGRIEELSRWLLVHMEDLGYQGVTQAERDAATVLAALDYAIQHDALGSLASAAARWVGREVGSVGFVVTIDEGDE